MIFEKIASILAEQFGVDADTISMETSFEDLGADLWNGKRCPSAASAG